MSSLENCNKLFGTSNIYEIFGLRKNCSQNDIKKAFHQLSRKLHPDRVPEGEKENATEKFQIITKLYGVLVNEDKRQLFDKEGVILDACDDILPMPTFQINNNHIEECKHKFIGSNSEKESIHAAYLEKNGNIKYILKRVPFLSEQDEPRVRLLIEESIDAGLLPKFLNVGGKSMAKKTK